MLCTGKYYWIVLYIVHVTAFCLGGPFFSGHGVRRCNIHQCLNIMDSFSVQKMTTFSNRSGKN